MTDPVVKGICKYCRAEELRALTLEGAFMWDNKLGMGIQMIGLIYCKKCDKIQKEYQFWKEMEKSKLKDMFRLIGLVR